jgi:hypothetical protein
MLERKRVWDGIVTASVPVLGIVILFVIIEVCRAAVSLDHAIAERLLALSSRLPDNQTVLPSHELAFRQLNDSDSQLRAADDAIRTDVQSLIADNAALKADNAATKELLTVVIISDVRIAKANLTLDYTLRNKVLLLVAELRVVGSRIKIAGDYPPKPTAPPGLHVSSSMWTAHRRAVEDFIGKQTWKQFWDIYHIDFDERVRKIINELQLAGVASNALVAFPANVGPNELDHNLPSSIENQLIRELLSAADNLTTNQSS